MAIPQIVGKYNDPVFHQIKVAFNQRSDDYPVLMLPVRLETKFMKYSRVVKPQNPDSGFTNAAVQDIYKLNYEIKLYFATTTEKKIREAAIGSKILLFHKEVQKISNLVSKIKEPSRADKLILRDAAGDLSAVTQGIQVSTSLAKAKNDLNTEVNALVTSIDRLKTPSRPVYEKGKLYIEALEKLNKSIDAIFVSNKINAASLDAELKNIDSQLKEMDSLAESSDFRATEDMIKEIQSKISHIKRQHKSGNVRLTNFKIGYTGQKDLKKEEYELRKKINELQKIVEAEHVPVVRVKEEIKTYPIKQLNAQIVKANYLLKAQNQSGIKDFKTLSTTQKDLFGQLKLIGSNAKMPLDGDINEVNQLKSNYAELKKQLLDFQKRSQKVKVVTRTEKATLTRTNTQIASYLSELQELEPGFKKVENQILGETKIRTSTISALGTRASVLAARDKIKLSAVQTPQQSLDTLKKELSALQEKIKVSTSNTILLPRAEYNQLKSSYFSLRDQVTNVLEANPLPEKNETKEETDKILISIENHILDQLTDVNDPRDRFYEEYRNKVIFNIQTVEVTELWVRIFPDDIAIDNHDERLTDLEESTAKDYYFEVFSKPEAERQGLKLGAWRAAASSLGVRRAAYAIRIMEPDEVKSGKIETIKNSLSEYLTKLGYDKKGLAKTKKEARIEQLLEAFENAPVQIKKLLGKSNFTPCIETKVSLDLAISYFRELIDLLGSSVTSRASGSQKATIERLAKLINESGKIVYEYYKTHLLELNDRFKPTFTFPSIEKKSKSWDRAGYTEAMPDRFVVITKRDNQYQHIVTGKTIPKPLPVSLDPSADQAEKFNHLPNGDMEVPEELKWLFDFEAAMEVGMAVKIPLDKEDYDGEFDLVMAYGVQNKDAAESQELINKIFKNHLYSDGGLEYLPTGTATNNTENVKSPYRALDNDLDGAFDLFFAEQSPSYPNSFSTTNELEISDGQFFKEAVGLPNDIADFIRNNGKRDICNGRAMNRALFNATLKYYFNVMVNNLLENFDINQTMLFMLHHVSGLGTLPVFRVDNQPYGILPVSPIKLFKSQGETKKGTESNYIKNLTLFLKQTKAAFQNFDKEPINITSEAYGKDPQAEFLKILGLEPLSKEFFFRFGVNAANRWQDPDGENPGFNVNWDHIIDKFSPAEVAANYNLLLKGLGHTTLATQANAIDKSPIYKNRFTEGNYILGHLVQDPKLGTDRLVVTDKGKNYLEWLVDPTTLNQLTQLKFPDLPKVEVDGEEQVQYSVLFAMLRGALVYDKSSYAIKAVDKLKHLDVGSLERLLASHIDLVSYRLDAWLTGLSDYRLRELRQTKPSGTYLGAYGFVHNLRREKGAISTAANLPKGLESSNGQNVLKLPDSQGFIHGPSMNHAVTAAVLRAGYNSIKAKGDNNNALSINLTSKRVRMGLHLLEGVGNGQETGALLGYMFERALHEKYTDGAGKPLEMDVYIYRLRRKFPTYSDSSVDPTDTSQAESLKASNVVDGLALIDHIEKELKKAGLLNADKTFVENIINDSISPIQFKGYPWGLSDQLPNPANPGVGSNANLERKKLRAIIHELDNMADAIDALGDLVTAEGVYQLVRGNHVRASAVLSSISEGKVPLDPEIIKSFRQGVMVTQRAILQIPVVGTSGSPWSGVPVSPRSKAEPSLNTWLAGMIGDPEKVSWKVAFGDTESSMDLTGLGLQPIDLVLLITSGGDENQNEIQARCIDFLLENGAFPEDEIIIQFNEAANSADLSFGEIVSLLQHLGKVIGSARGADARDYRISEDDLNFGPTALGIDTDDLSARMKGAFTEYKSLFDTLAPFDSSKTSYSEPERTLAISSLKSLTVFGFPGFYPTDPQEDVLAFAQRIISAKSKMAENIGFAQAKFAEMELEIDQAKWISFVLEFSSKFFGSGFKMLPKTTLSNKSDINGQLDMPWVESPMRNHVEGFMQDWLTGISLVRNRLAYMETVSILRDVLYADSLSLNAVQLPFDLNNLPAVNERDYWLGAAFPKTYKPDGDRLSLLIFEKENLADVNCGLILDEWMEIIPDEKETTGIAFHFNQPDSRAPQNLLLAVPPEKKGTWDFEALALCVEEAFNLAKLRSIEPDQVEASMFSQLLPATATLAFGDDEFARKLAESDDDEDNDPQPGDDQKLGYYIDYTNVNTGYEPE
ncbi:hypothetical protein SAMN04489724_3273 [Algoriphagus locisalis]|uniref:Uncharacterized protein n=1 Tax=Algoriphagus locisalis TaxID=305507 RepID=A0A1I7CJT0_9BACT|nr:hypothetical protein [Algoriphagus locisalis]SFT99700.1 hypothetical protein SAMN04489724_3273 [Algoriphagus locisalis]